MNNEQNDKKMRTFEILNHLEDVVKTVEVKTMDELKDIVYDIEEYHGTFGTHTVNEITGK